MHKDQKHVYEDLRSTGYSFLLVGILGAILLVLLDTGVLPVHMATYMKILMSIVMGAFFLFFIFVGIKAFLELKGTQVKMVEEADKEEEILDWFLLEHKQDLLDLPVEEDNPEEAYYPRAGKMKELFDEKYPDMSADDKDYYIDLLYARIFED